MRVLLVAMVVLGLLLTAPALSPVEPAAAECLRVDPATGEVSTDPNCKPSSTSVQGDG